MLDLRFVADNIDLVQKKLTARNSSLDLSEVAELSAERRKTIQQVEALKAEKNQVSAQIAVLKRNKQNADELIEKMRAQGESIKELDTLLADIEAKLTEYMYTIPNLIDDSVPIGKDSEDNVEVRRHLSPRQFDLTP